MWCWSFGSWSRIMSIVRGLKIITSFPFLPHFWLFPPPHSQLINIFCLLSSMWSNSQPSNFHGCHLLTSVMHMLMAVHMWYKFKQRKLPYIVSVLWSTLTRSMLTYIIADQLLKVQLPPSLKTEWVHCQWLWLNSDPGGFLFCFFRSSSWEQNPRISMGIKDALPLNFWLCIKVPN